MALRDLSAALWTLRSHQESAKILRTTTSLLRCFLFFDICYMVAGIAMIMVGMTSEYYDRDWMLLLGGFFGAFASSPQPVTAWRLMGCAPGSCST